MVWTYDLKYINFKDHTFASGSFVYICDIVHLRLYRHTVLSIFVPNDN